MYKPRRQCVELQQHMSEDREYVNHISEILEKSLPENRGPGHNPVDENLIRRTLREHFQARSMDAMEWILKCVVKDVAFDQDISNEIPILCRFYNEYIGKDAWNEKDGTMMMVLNKYAEIKAGGYGNFARAAE